MSKITTGCDSTGIEGRGGIWGRSTTRGIAGSSSLIREEKGSRKVSAKGIALDNKGVGGEDGEQTKGV